MIKDFNDCLHYHNIHIDSLAFKAVLDDPAIIGMDKAFLDNKSTNHRTDLILGEYLVKLSEHLGVTGSRLLKRGQWSYETPDWFDHRHHMLNPEESKNSWLESIIDDSNEYKNFLIKKYSNDPKIEYLYKDVLKHEPKEDYYDIVIMRSAIEHFSLENQALLFNKIKKALTKTGWYCGDTPANPDRDNDKQHSAHEYEWKDKNEAREVLNKHFDEVDVYSIYCNIDPRETIFWKCR